MPRVREAKAPGRELNAILEAAKRSLRRSVRVRRNVPGGGRLFFDRPAPFLCVYRKSDGRAGAAGEDTLPTTQAAFLIAAHQTRQAERVCEAIVEELSPRFGGFLIIELWPAPADSTGRRFRILAPPRYAEEPLLAVLRDALKRIKAEGRELDARVTTASDPSPPRKSPLLSREQVERYHVVLIGLEYPAVFRSSDSVHHPAELRRFRRRLGIALQKAFFEFAKGRDPELAATHEALGSRDVRQAAAAVDRRLSEVSSAFDFLLYVTPVDVEEVWQHFRAGRYAKDPVFSYRPLPFDPRELKRLLYSAPIEKVEDPLLWELFAEKQDDLDRRITLLSDRGSPRFRYGALQVYGGVEGCLLELSRNVLETISPENPSMNDSRDPPPLPADRVAELALAEIEYYRTQDSHFEAGIEIRDDIAAEMMVSQNRLFISSSLLVRPERLDALLNHEVGTHLLTWFNGRRQPLSLLHEGLAGYEPTQEGLAVLAEYLCGGLTAERLRTLAARVEAVHFMLDGASFVETFRHIEGVRGFSPRRAFRLVARIFRSGGLTKDAGYLRGLRDLLAALARGQRLEPLLAGKVSLRNASVLRALAHREIVRPPTVWPRYLESAESRERLRRCETLTVLDLVAEVVP